MKGKPIIGVWRSWLAHLVWDQRVLCSSHSTPTKIQSNYLNFKWLLFCFPAFCSAKLAQREVAHHCAYGRLYDESACSKQLNYSE